MNKDLHYEHQLDLERRNCLGLGEELGRLDGADEADALEERPEEYLLKEVEPAVDVRDVEYSFFPMKSRGMSYD